MESSAEIDAAILEILEACGAMPFEALIRTLHDLTWNQIFVSVDRLSGEEMIVISRASRFDYLLSVPTKDAHQLVASKNPERGAP